MTASHATPPRVLETPLEVGRDGYASLGELFSVPRPRWAEVRTTTGQEAMPRSTKR